jgi:hypothetical protein
MWRGLFKLFLFRKFLGSGSKNSRKGGCGFNMGCLGLVLLIAIVVFAFRSCDSEDTLERNDDSPSSTY